MVFHGFNKILIKIVPLATTFHILLKSELLNYLFLRDLEALTTQI